MSNAPTDPYDAPRPGARRLPAPYDVRRFAAPYHGRAAPYAVYESVYRTTHPNRGGTAAGTTAAPATGLRIVHVGQSLVRVGGIETCLKSLIRYFDPAQARLVKCLVTSTENYDPEAAADLGVPVEIAGPEQVRQAAREADVLLAWGPRALGEWLADCRPKLCVFVAHGEGFWTRWILEGCAGVIDHVIAVSRRVQELACQGFDTTVIPNGVDATTLAPTRPPAAVRASLGFEGDDFVVGFAGRFAAEKRVHLLLEALAGLPRRFKALLVGEGPLKPDMMELANALIPGRYAFATGINDMGDYYAAMDALCLPSEEEGYGMVILEAMLCERPVVATAVGCVPELFRDRVNGVVVEGTAEAIREAALLLDAHPHWRRAVAAEGKATAQEVGYAATMAAAYQELILRLWSAKQGGQK